jgi:hypothetical protein
VECPVAGFVQEDFGKGASWRTEIPADLSYESSSFFIFIECAVRAFVESLRLWRVRSAGYRAPAYKLHAQRHGVEPEFSYRWGLGYFYHYCDSGQRLYGQHQLVVQQHHG